MKRMTAGDLQALELLMQTTPGFEHFDSGADGILLSAETAAFTVLTGNISPACLRSVPTAAIPFLHSKIKVAHLMPERKPVMDNKIEVFKNEQFGEVRTILDGETLLFCGSDVARALGYARPGKAIIDHCKGVLKRDTLTSGGTQSLSYITEVMFTG